MSKFDSVVTIIRAQLHDPETERPTIGEDSLVDDLELDSLDLVELCMALEEDFGIEIPDSDVDGWKTVNDVVATVDRLTEAEAA